MLGSGGSAADLAEQVNRSATLLLAGVAITTSTAAEASPRRSARGVEDQQRLYRRLGPRPRRLAGVGWNLDLEYPAQGLGQDSTGSAVVRQIRRWVSQ